MTWKISIYSKDVCHMLHSLLNIGDQLIQNLKAESFDNDDESVFASPNLRVEKIVSAEANEQLMRGFQDVMYDS